MFELAVGLLLLADALAPVLNEAFEHLRSGRYDAAIMGFRRAVQMDPDRADIRRNLGYALLKTGETVAAREEFAEVVRLAPSDTQAALEYAFLCNETGEVRQARLLFLSLRGASPEAARAFEAIDGPLAAGIARWKAALQADPGNFSAHVELARLAESRDDWALAAEHYESAWRRKPARRDLLLDTARAWARTGRGGDSLLALIAASRCDDARTAERARPLLPRRYPYVYEFRQAIALDPDNLGLRRELAYLHLEMGNAAEAESTFEEIVRRAPADHLSVAQLGFLRLQRKDIVGARELLERLLAAPDVEEDLADRVRSALGLPKLLRRRSDSARKDAVSEARLMAKKSYDAGYFPDALKYLRVVHENDPLDFATILQLGRTHNMLRQDREALKWFEMARHSPDPSISGEAVQARRNLAPQSGAVRTTVWTMPFYSSRWRNAFNYGQVKTEFRLAGIPLRPYASLRFIGDVRGRGNQPYPQYLSETAFLIGGGVATPVWRGLMGWAEAGVAVSYLDRSDQARTLPDYRGGASFSYGFGRLLGSRKPGLFAETHDDAIFVSRFANSLLFYTQNKVGVTIPAGERAALQLVWNGNLTTDTRRQEWANFVETGPGLRLRLPGLPPGMLLSADLLRGLYTIPQSSRPPRFRDLRFGAWYGHTR